MELKEYRWRFDQNYRMIADKVQCNRSYLSLIANKKKIPGKHLAKAISEATDGKVTVQELLTEKNLENENSIGLKAM